MSVITGVEKWEARYGGNDGDICGCSPDRGIRTVVGGSRLFTRGLT